MCYRFYGVSAHAAAAPHLGRSALDAVELMNVGANFLREHILPEARIHYAITNAGGSSPGTVQPYAEVLYLIRAPEISQTREIRDRIDNIARGAALMTDTRVEPVFIKACSNIMPSRLLEEVLYRNMRAVARPRYTREELRRAAAFLSGADPEPGIAAVRTAVVPYRHTRQAQPGSSDVGDVSWICPTAQILTATWAAGTQAHTWQAFAQGKGAVAHKGMLYAGKVLAGAILDMLEQPQLAEQAKAEHKAQLGGRVYESPVPDGVKPDAAGAWAK
ncbi:p-aminobenzoyl-glutamate hydrolase subunit B [bioreactor metagenome]|uniref:p-aminobenzoyl-glutamate hydrolase subunit B n=1 Tax=bioreactor metagenome TaxID=1076179 RepID=A0A645CD21_9ZZZZ